MALGGVTLGVRMVGVVILAAKEVFVKFKIVLFFKHIKKGLDFILKKTMIFRKMKCFRSLFFILEILLIKQMAYC